MLMTFPATLDPARCELKATDNLQKYREGLGPPPVRRKKIKLDFRKRLIVTT